MTSLPESKPQNQKGQELAEQLMDVLDGYSVGNFQNTTGSKFTFADRDEIAAQFVTVLAPLFEQLTRFRALEAAARKYIIAFDADDLEVRNSSRDALRKALTEGN